MIATSHLLAQTTSVVDLVARAGIATFGAPFAAHNLCRMLASLFDLVLSIFRATDLGGPSQVPL